MGRAGRTCEQETSPTLNFVYRKPKKMDGGRGGGRGRQEKRDVVLVENFFCFVLFVSFSRVVVSADLLRG